MNALQALLVAFMGSTVSLLIVVTLAVAWVRYQTRQWLHNVKVSGVCPVCKRAPDEEIVDATFDDDEEEDDGPARPGAA